MIVNVLFVNSYSFILHSRSYAMQKSTNNVSSPVLFICTHAIRDFTYWTQYICLARPTCLDPSLLIIVVCLCYQQKIDVAGCYLE